MYDRKNCFPGSTEQAIKIADQAASQMVSNVPEREWATTSYFNPDWLNQIQMHQGKRMPNNILTKFKCIYLTSFFS